MLVGLIEHDRVWLNLMIGDRDTVAHYKALLSNGFTVKRENGKLFVAEPQDESGNPFRATLEIHFCNLVGFVEDFIAHAIYVAMPAGLTITVKRPSDGTDCSQPRFGVAMTPGTLAE